MLKRKTKFWQSALENCKEEQNSEKSFKEICKALFVKTNGRTSAEKTPSLNINKTKNIDPVSDCVWSYPGL